MKAHAATKLSAGLLAIIISVVASLAVPRGLAAEPAASLPTQAPHDPDAALRQIELNVALKQYEKALMACADTELKIALGPEEAGLTDEQIAAWREKQARKLDNLHHYSQDNRKRIEALIDEGRKADRAAAGKINSIPHSQKPGARLPASGGETGVTQR